MSLITWNTEANAPCCPGEILGPKIREQDSRGRFKWAQQSVLVQTDWDYPGVAGSFGWNMAEVQQEERTAPCDHSGTDGTVTCPECSLTATDFISAAYDWLISNDGATAEDPGYFS